MSALSEPWRMAMNGTAIVFGDASLREVVAACPRSAMFDEKQMAKWIDRAEHIVTLHNASLEAKP